jgi:DNA polymerase
MTQKDQQLEELAQEVKVCEQCQLHQGRTSAVPGEGDPEAEILIIGEGPGKNEDQQGRPFVGAAGKFLEELLASIGLTRDQVFIANVVKCRPPNNRDPLPEEVQTCWPFLEKQLQIIQPKVIVTLGRHSLQRFFPGHGITQYHGRALRRDFPPLGKQAFFICYHPAAALYNGSLRETLLEDFKKLPRLLEVLRKES